MKNIINKFKKEKIKYIKLLILAVLLLSIILVAYITIGVYYGYSMQPEFHSDYGTSRSIGFLVVGSITMIILTVDVVASSVYTYFAFIRKAFKRKKGHN